MTEYRMTRSQLKSRLEQDATGQDLVFLITKLVSREQIIEWIAAGKKKRLEATLFQRFGWMLEIVADTK